MLLHILILHKDSNKYLITKQIRIKNRQEHPNCICFSISLLHSHDGFFRLSSYPKAPHGQEPPHNDASPKVRSRNPPFSIHPGTRYTHIVLFFSFSARFANLFINDLDLLKHILYILSAVSP